MTLRQKIFDALTVLGLLAVTAGLLIYPSMSVSAAGEGVELCFNVLIPSLFPFFVISNLTVELGLADRLGRALSPVMEPLFNVGGACAPALLLGFIGGYPVGARTVIALYQSGRCSKAEAERMLAFCNNSGPAFIFGVVGAGIFSSSRVGLTLYLIHMAASVAVGLIFRSHGEREIRRVSGPRTAPLPFPAAFVKSVSSAFSGCLGICGFVIFFTVFIKLLVASGLLDGLARLLGGALGFAGFDAQWARLLLTGCIELTSGVWSLRDAPALGASIAMAAFMLGWAGLSVHCQVLSFLSSTGLSARTYILGKLLHGLISAALAGMLAPFITRGATVGTFLAQQVEEMSRADFASVFLSSALFSAGVLAVFLIIALISLKIGGKNGKDAL